MKNSERLHIALKNKGLKQEDVGDLLGIKPNTVSYRIKNDAFKDHDIKHICDHFGINSDWVINGVGEMFGPGNEAKDDPVAYQNNKEGALFPEMYENEQKLRKQIDELQGKLQVSVEKEREIRDKYERLLEKMVGGIVR